MAHPSLPPPDEAPDQCPLCRLDLDAEGECPVHGNPREALREQRDEWRRERWRNKDPEV